VLGKLLDPNLGLENARLRQQLSATSQAGLDSLAVLLRVEPSPVGLSSKQREIERKREPHTHTHTHTSRHILGLVDTHQRRHTGETIPCRSLLTLICLHLQKDSALTRVKRAQLMSNEPCQCQRSPISIKQALSESKEPYKFHRQKDPALANHKP
jgi:hypothetical protein